MGGRVGVWLTCLMGLALAACGGGTPSPPVNQPPAAEATATPASGPAPLTVQFSAAASVDPDGTIARYEWDLDGNGSYEVVNGGVAQQYTFSYEGLHMVGLRVTDDDGATNTNTVTVQVGAASGGGGGTPNPPANQPPVAAITATPAAGPAPLTVQFSAAASVDPDGTITRYDWDLDGDRSYEALNGGVAQQHTYTTDGWHLVGLRVTDNDGATAMTTVTVSIGTALGRGDWWMFGHDPQHTHRSPYVGCQTGTLKWSYPTGGGESSPAIGADGTLYVGGEGDLYAINSDGTLKWKYPIAQFASSSPAIGADGTVYVGSCAINPDGTLKWSYPIWVGSCFPAIGADGTVYVSSDDWNLYAINPDGTLKWSYPPGYSAYPSPAIGADGTVYVSDAASESMWDDLYAINPDGTLKWSYRTYEWFRVGTSSPAIGADGTVYVGAGVAGAMSWGHLSAIRPNGTLKWSCPTSDGSSDPAIGSDGTVYVGVFTFHSGMPDGGDLYAINPDGTLKWISPTGGYRSSPAIGADGTLYVGGSGNLYAIKPDGTLKWSYPMRVGSSSPAIGADGTVYVGGIDNLYAFADP